MGLIILLLIGTLFGWLASIALRIEGGRDIVRNMVAGVIGALGVGLFLSGGIFLGALRATTLLGAAVGAFAIIGLYNLIRRNRAHS